MKKKLRVGIIFGGRSAEHEVSLQSARNVFEALDREKFEPVLIGIDKSGGWHINEASKVLLQAKNPRFVKLSASSSDVSLLPSTTSIGSANLVTAGAKTPLAAIDVAFPILHGPFGEDGTVQGLLKLAQVPFVGPDVLGSAVGMDKDVMKRLLRDAGIPIGKFLAYGKNEIKKINFDSVKNELGMPVFVKPANLGSSVGISKAGDKKTFEDAVAFAFKFDSKILVEEFIKGREIECAVLGNESPIASVPGEIVTSGGHEFYSYDAKYIDEKGANLEIPAKISDAAKQRVQELALKTFQVLCCEGLSRVDTFLKDDGSVVVNEINTIPGFTNISMYPKLFEATGIPYSELITKLIEFAILRFERERANQVSR